MNLIHTTGLALLSAYQNTHLHFVQVRKPCADFRTESIYIHIRIETKPKRREFVFIPSSPNCLRSPWLPGTAEAMHDHCPIAQAEPQRGTSAVGIAGQHSRTDGTFGHLGNDDEAPNPMKHRCVGRRWMTFLEADVRPGRLNA